MKIVVLSSILLLSANAVQAQDVRIPPNIERLAERAVQKVNVTVDEPLLKLAAGFLSKDNPEQNAVKSLISGLKGIYVRSYEFANVGEYSPADVESVRKQLKTPGWSEMVNVRTRDGEDVDVYFRLDNQKISGLVVIAAQPRMLTIVNIVGPIDLQQLASLGGQFGIPKLEVAKPRKEE